MRTLHLDFETYSETDIKNGSYRYFDDPKFEILLWAYAYDEEEVQVIDLTCTSPPASLLQDLTNPNVLKIAYNAAFEREAIHRYFGIYCDPEQWQDAMIMASYAGLPRSLAQVGAALNLAEDEAKDKEGKALIQYFCKPCKPTKANRMRRRNLPSSNPGKWAKFIEYCRQDVVTERVICHRLMRYKVPEREWTLWRMDQHINDRGIAIDTILAESAVIMASQEAENLIKEAQNLTGLNNPNSVAQLKEFLGEEDSLDKKKIAEMLKTEEDPKKRRLLEIRQELGKSSVKKYQAMLNCVCKDGRLRGALQFYKANRTGRWSGALIQPQNFPQNHLENLDWARRMACERRTDELKLVYGSVSDTLSQLIRTAIIPADGFRLAVADFSAIEARVIAWLADEHWRMEAFRQGKDIYCDSASKMFHVPVEKHGMNADLRQKGKVAELACIAEGQLVSTSVGLVPIQNVTLDMLVWDGEEYVRHQGVICKGRQQVITWDGLTATPNHVVYVEDAPGVAVSFAYAAQSRSRLQRPVSGRDGVRAGEDRQQTLPVEREMESPEGAGQVSDLRPNALDRSGRSEERKDEGMQEMLGQGPREAKVYDIVNAGPRHRYVVSGALVHNCGYGGSVGAMVAMGGSNLGLTDEEMTDIVKKWREASPNIVQLWWDLDKMTMDAMTWPGQPFEGPKGIYAEKLADAGFLLIHLPSGRDLYYLRPRIIENKFGRPALSYMGNEGGKWGRGETFGGKLTENVVQAIARDCLAEAMLKTTQSGYDIIFHVHDEMIVEAPRKRAEEALQDMLTIMSAPISWAPGLLLKGDGYICDYYRKD